MTVLVTGGTGFIGGNLLDRLIASGRRDIVLLVRPSTSRSRYARFEEDGVQIALADIRDRQAVHEVFDAYRFDVVYHLAAIRGVRAIPWEAYSASNVQAVETIARAVMGQDGRLVYCSSVGVFGTIPQDLPATESTARQVDNAYHRSKIEAEALLHQMVAEGLEVVIIRPTITYGPDDDGFPYTLIRLVDRGLFLHCPCPLKIHLGHVDSLAEAFVQASELDVQPGSSYVIADRAPVYMRDLVDLISERLRNRPYPQWKVLPKEAFDLACFVPGRVLKNEAWKSRFQLISQSWYYDVHAAQRDLGLDLPDTLDQFGNAVEWYLHSQRRAWRSQS
jgi:nucleoside-diphosphate-sugar epimerase